MPTLRLCSWNVNGIRANAKKGFFEFLDVVRPDVLGLQEVKARLEQFDRLPEVEERGYKVFWNAAEKPGYSGTAVLSKIEPLSVSQGIGDPEHDREGRVTTAEFKDFFFVTVYTPNAQDGLARLPYRTKWDRAFLAYCRELEKRKPVVFCGDLNAAHKEIDLAHPSANRGMPGFSDEERAGVDEMLAAGYVDTFRKFFPDKARAYSWWSYFANARANNVGWRIDYFMASKKLEKRLVSADILPEIHGSDHCPVMLELEAE
jgi:exodeoxyribonuclease-3